MNRAFLPFRFLPSAALVQVLGNDLRGVAVLAVKAVIKHRKSLEVAHQQVVFGRHSIALSTRISPAGELVVDLDVGDPKLDGRIILEDDLRRARELSRVVAGVSGQRRRN